MTPLKADIFKVKVSTEGNDYFKSIESPEKELTAHPAKLQVKVTEGTAEAPIATKVSDGTTALTRDNITAIENASSLEGIVDGDEVSLKVRDDAPWSSLSYEENKLGGNTVSLNSLKDSFELEGTDSVNYVQDADDHGTVFSCYPDLARIITEHKFQCIGTTYTHHGLCDCIDGS